MNKLLPTKRVLALPTPETIINQPITKTDKVINKKIRFNVTLFGPMSKCNLQKE